jgi:hypothetical protein
VVDVALTVLLAYLLSVGVGMMDIWENIYRVVFVLGEILHYIFCVYTAVIVAIDGFLRNNI